MCNECSKVPNKILNINKPKVRNVYYIYDDYAEIILVNRNKEEVGRAKIDVEDIEKVSKYRWNLSKLGYVTSNSLRVSKGIMLWLHRLVMNIEDKKIFVDHKNHNNLDNRKSELRVSTNKENSRNKGYARSNTGFIGVSFSKRDCVYQANIKVDYKKIHLGQSAILDEALKMRLEAEVKYFGEFSPQKHLFEEYGIGDGSFV